MKRKGLQNIITFKICFFTTSVTKTFKFILKFEIRILSFRVKEERAEETAYYTEKRHAVLRNGKNF